MRTIIILLLALVFSQSSFAQNRNRLRSHHAKNLKHWEKENKTILVTSNSERNHLKGAEAKNLKFWNIKQNDEPIIVSTKPKRKLKGGRAKNQKPWSN